MNHPSNQERRLENDLAVPTEEVAGFLLREIRLLRKLIINPFSTEQSRLDQSIAHLFALPETPQTLQWYRARAHQLRNRSFANALREYREATAIHRGHHELHFEYAYLLLETLSSPIHISRVSSLKGIKDLLDDSVDHLQKATQLKQDDSNYTFAYLSTRTLLLIFAEQERDLAEQLEALLAAFDDQGDPRTFSTFIGGVQTLLEHWEEHQGGEWDGEYHGFASPGSLYEEMPVYWSLLAQEQHARGETEKANVSLRTAFHLAGQRGHEVTKVYTRMGNLRFKTAYKDTMLFALERLQATGTSRKEILPSKAEYHRAWGEKDAAIAAYQELFTDFPGDLIHTLNYVDLLYEEAQWEQFLEVASSLLRDHQDELPLDDDRELQENIITSHIMLDDFEAASKAIIQLQLDPEKDEDFLDTLQRTFEMRGNHLARTPYATGNTAVEAYSQAIQLSQNPAKLYLKRAEVCEGLSRLDEAKADLQRALEANGNPEWVYKKLSDISEKSFQYDEALTHLISAAQAFEQRLIEVSFDNRMEALDKLRDQIYEYTKRFRERLSPLGRVFEIDDPDTEIGELIQRLKSLLPETTPHWL